MPCLSECSESHLIREVDGALVALIAFICLWGRGTLITFLAFVTRGEIKFNFQGGHGRTKPLIPFVSGVGWAGS